jgi:hypothetical protein
VKVLLTVAVLAAVIYLTIRVIERRGLPRPKRHRDEPRITGPDDDPDFLRGLDRPDDDR